MQQILEFENLSAVNKVTKSADWVLLETSLEELQNLLYYLREHLEYFYLLDVFVTKSFDKGPSELNYLIQNLEHGPVLCVRCDIRSTEKIPSNANIWENCLIKEREIQELHGVPFEFELKHSLLVKDNSETWDLPYCENPIGRPQHPLLKNELLWSFEIENNNVKAAKTMQGFTHLGIEKSFQDNNANEILMKISRINCRRSFALEALWSDNIEKSLEIDISDRAKAIRMLFLELERIADHFHYFVNIAYEIQFLQMQQVFREMKRTVLSVISYYTGSEGHLPLNCIGGIRFDIPRGWVAFVNSALEEIRKVLCDFIHMMESSSFWKERFNCGVVSSGQALDFGFSGPNLRASGINFDLRKNKPYYFYSDIDFTIPVGQRGSVLDRFLVRKEEVIQSLNILNQVLDNIPPGPIVKGDFNYFREINKQVNMDRDRFIDSAAKSPTIVERENINFIEASNGYMGLFLKGNEKGNVQNFRMSSGDQSALDAYRNIVVGADYDDALLIYTSLNIHISEVEK